VFALSFIGCDKQEKTTAPGSISVSGLTNGSEPVETPLLPWMI